MSPEPTNDYEFSDDSDAGISRRVPAKLLQVSRSSNLISSSFQNHITLHIDVGVKGKTGKDSEDE